MPAPTRGPPPPTIRRTWAALGSGLRHCVVQPRWPDRPRLSSARPEKGCMILASRSEEHTSELQSPCNLVCRLLLEKKKKNVYVCVCVTECSTSSQRSSLTSCV